MQFEMPKPTNIYARVVLEGAILLKIGGALTNIDQLLFQNLRNLLNFLNTDATCHQCLGS